MVHYLFFYAQFCATRMRCRAIRYGLPVHIFLLVMLLGALPSRAAETVFPGATWIEASPESQGVDMPEPERSRRFARSHGRCRRRAGTGGHSPTVG